MQCSKGSFLKNLFGIALLATTILLVHSSPLAKRGAPRPGAVYLINWTYLSQPGKLLMAGAVISVVQQSECGDKDKNTVFNAFFMNTNLDPIDPWRLELTHAPDNPTKDKDGRCVARSKATLIVTSPGPDRDTVLKVRLTQLCTDKTCSPKDKYALHDCVVLKAPPQSQQIVKVNQGREVQCNLVS